LAAAVLGLLALGLAGPVGPVPSAGAAQPAPEATLVGVTQVAAGRDHTCALLTTRQVRCWGDNGFGQLGDGTETARRRAVAVRAGPGAGNLANVVQISAGAYATCARMANGQARCWGIASLIGDGTQNDRRFPTLVRNPAGPAALAGVAQVTVGGATACARLTNGQARCWGYAGFGGLGNGTTANDTARRPVVVRAVSGPGPLTGVTQLDAAQQHVCARVSNGQARCWGYNVDGRVGDGTVNTRNRPVVVRNAAFTGPLVGVTQIAAGGAHTCARVNTGQARCWGDNGDGQLGDDTTSPSPLPVEVTNTAGSANLVGVASLEADSRHTCAVLTNDQLRCWGQGIDGRLGDGDTGNHPRPVAVRNTAGTANFVGATSVTTGAYHSCARLTNGQARCWGYNLYGNLGDGTLTQRVLPVVVQIP
jgi:alpha-tubulin suppressor-like RCC1 family protein